MLESTWRVSSTTRSADFTAGKIKAAQAIKGAVMRETKGAARPEVVEQIIVGGTWSDAVSPVIDISEDHCL